MDYNYVFFLGGYDLEMVPIKTILGTNKQKYFNRELKGGAKASEYKTKIEKFLPDEIPVLIELEIDIVLPAEPLTIGHHYERDGKDKKT